MLLLDVDQGTPHRRLQVFVASNFWKLVEEMPSSRREWTKEILSDLFKHGQISNICDDLLHQFKSLGVGPIRTSLSGSIDFEKEQNIVALIDSKIRDLDPQRYRERCVSWLHLLREIEEDAHK